MFAMLRLLLTVVTSIIFLNNNLYSQTSIFSNSVPNSLVTCGDPDTVQVVISSVNGINSLDLSANLSSDFQFVSILSNPNISIVDTSNINLPIFRFSILPSGTSDTLLFLIKSTCNSSSNFLQFSLADSNGTAIGSAVNSSQINADQPNVILSGVTNTNPANQMGVDLTQMIKGQKFRRTFRVDYTSLVGDLDSVSIMVEKPYYDIAWVSGGTITPSSTGDSVTYKFAVADFGGNPLSPTNNSFVFHDSISLSDCPTTSLSVNSGVELTWGCGGTICQTTGITTSGSVIVSNPEITYVSTTSDLTNYCQETHSYSFTFENSQNSTNSLADYAYNLVIQLPFVNNGSNVYNPASFPNTIQYDSVKINGQIVPFSAGLFGLYPRIELLTTSQYTGGGLTDEDGDGFINDLRTDSSIKVEVFYKNNGPTYTCNTGSGGRKIIYHYAHKGIYVDYQNMC